MVAVSMSGPYQVKVDLPGEMPTGLTGCPKKVLDHHRRELERFGAVYEEDWIAPIELEARVLVCRHRPDQQRAILLVELLRGGQRIAVGSVCDQGHIHVSQGDPATDLGKVLEGL